MKSIIRSCAGRPVAVIMAIAAVMLAGIASAARLPLGRLPEIEVPRLFVEAALPGLPASDIRTLVTVPLEDALSSAKGLVRSSSISTDGRSILTLEFSWGEDIKSAAGRVREILDSAYIALPEGAAKPRVLSFDPGAEPLMTVSIAHSGGDLAFARRFAEREVKARLRRVEGAGQVLVAGGTEREVAVAVDMKRAAARGLTVYEVARAVSAENDDSPAGSIREGRVESVAVARGRASSVEELADLVAPGPSGPFRLGDIADVAKRNAPRKSLFVVDGEERVAIELYKRTGADPVATARDARSAIEKMATEFSPDLRIEILDDSSLPIAASIRNLAAAAAAGAVIAAAVLFVLLRDATGAALVASSIPVSVSATLSILGIAGKSLNGMSLGGLAVAVGMISDNAVVVIDALSSEFESAEERPDAEAVADATVTVVGGTFGSTITTALVFLPIVFLPGALGALYSDLALAIVAGTVSGWFGAVLALPSLYRVSWTPRPARKRDGLEKAYRSVLAKALRKPRMVILSAAVLALIGTAMTIAMPVVFMPDGAVSSLVIRAVFPRGTDPDGMSREAEMLTASLRAVPGTSFAYGRCGAEADDCARLADPSREDECLVITCPLDSHADPAAMKRSLLDAARTASPHAVVSVSEPEDPTTAVLDLGKRSRLAIRSDSPKNAAAKTEMVEAMIRSAAGASAGTMSRYPSGTTRKILVAPSRMQSASLGVSLSDAALALRTATAGASAATMSGDDEAAAILVFAAGTGSADGTGSVSGVMSVPVSAAQGKSIPASAVAMATVIAEPAALARLDRSDVVYLEAIPLAGREGDLEHALKQVLDQPSLAVRSNDSVFSRYGATMTRSVMLVLALLYFALGAQFESFLLPVQIMATIPLAMAGVGPALALSGTGLDSGSMLGLIVLFGVVVNNAILLHESAEAKLATAKSRCVAAYAGASDRVRPVVATTLTTVVALIPMCLSPAGAAQRSMAVAMLGGVIASTVLTLFVSPVVFSGALAGAFAGRCSFQAAQRTLSADSRSG